jgi:electron transfer flavoprotein alpha subunit
VPELRQIEVLQDKCVGCGLCVKACPFGAISLRERKAVIDYDKCTFCGSCVPVCKKFNAIRQNDTAPTAKRQPAGEVWVFCEVDPAAGRLAGVSVELLGLARDLAGALNVNVGALLAGRNLAGYAREAISFGADRVYLMEHPDLERYDDERYGTVISRLVTAHKPEILLGGATAVGRALLPRIAIKVHTGLTADCTELNIDPKTGLLRQTRPAFGGNILATITCENHRPQMATVRPGVLRRKPADSARAGEFVACPPQPEELRSALEWLDFRPRGKGDVDLREAEVIVAAGYGAGGPDGVRLVADLAKALGGALGASRSVVDAGWLAYPHQVGQTGTTVQPKLYVACGISGAIQHIVGMQNSETIVAINRDPDAPIFQCADYALVGDLAAIIPELLRQIEKKSWGRSTARQRAGGPLS